MYQLPESVKFLNEISPLPKLVEAGLQYLGVKEFPGVANNPIIMDMAEGLNVDNIFLDDTKQAWCALFINHLIRVTGKPLVDIKKDKFNYLRAKWLLNWGNPVPAGNEMLGDIGVFDRDAGGHVGIIIAESHNTFVILGGNQSNTVSFTEMQRSRFLGARRYYATAPPASVKKYIVAASGNVSMNED